MSEELKPCPFCGNNKLTDNNIDYEFFYGSKGQQDHYEYFVECSCNARGPFHSDMQKGNVLAEAARLWNERSEP